MTNQALIQALCNDLTPVRTASVEHHLACGIALGGMASLAILLLSVGVQPQLFTASAIGTLAVKLGCLLVVVGYALRAVRALARPGGRSQRVVPPLALIALTLGAIALGQQGGVPVHDRSAFWMGGSWQSCSARIAALSLPLIVGIGWALRRQAPVQLRQAGAVAGLAAGSLAAAIYALACSESSAGFVLLWYSLGIGAASAIGALLGPTLLRW